MVTVYMHNIMVHLFFTMPLLSHNQAVIAASPLRTSHTHFRTSRSSITGTGKNVYSVTPAAMCGVIIRKDSP